MLALTALTSDRRRELKAHAKSRIMTWVDRMSPPPNARAAMSRSVDLVFSELPARDTWFEAMTVGLGESKEMPSTFAGPTWRVFPCADVLTVATVVPGWARGWRQILVDDVPYDQMTWFLHYARQYIHRAHVAKVLMFAWDREGRVLHPFGPVGISRTYGPHVQAETMRTMLRNAVSDARSQFGRPAAETPTRTVWAGGWRWWDSGEVTEELVPVLSKTVRRALGRAVAAESTFRRVDPDPASWSDWMLVNFDMLWEAVWFDRSYPL